MQRIRTRAGQGTARRWAAALFLSIGLTLAVSNPAMADDYDPQRSGHPLRIVAYVLHPIGVAIDYLFLRPAHWIASREPMQTLFGHED